MTSKLRKLPEKIDTKSELERLRADARHNEASALANVARKRDAHWQSIVADKDEALANKDAEIARLNAMLDLKQ